MSLDPTLLLAYHNSHYRMQLPQQDCVLQIGAIAAELDAFLYEQAFLQGQACQHACFITAHNPRSMRLPPALNRSRNAALEQVLQARRLHYVHGVGFSADANSEWPAEPGFLVLHIGLALTQSLAIHFGQNAVLSLQPGQPVALLVTLPALQAGGAGR